MNQLYQRVNTLSIINNVNKENKKRSQNYYLNNLASSLRKGLCVEKFINCNSMENKKKKPRKRNPADYINKVIEYNRIVYKNKDYNVSQRVLLPEKNTILVRPHTKKFFSLDKNFRYTSDGSYQSLINRTPMSFPVKGRRRINLSFDGRDNNSSKLGSTFDNIFRESLNKDDGNRLFGVERKNIIKNHNLESQAPPFKFGRKHFFIKEEKTSLY